MAILAELSASVNIGGHSRMVMWVHLLWQRMYGAQVMVLTGRVIDSYHFITTRFLPECWHIQCHPNTLYRDRGTLPREYTAL